MFSSTVRRSNYPCFDTWKLYLLLPLWKFPLRLNYRFLIILHIINTLQCFLNGGKFGKVYFRWARSSTGIHQSYACRQKWCDLLILNHENQAHGKRICGIFSFSPFFLWPENQTKIFQFLLLSLFIFRFLTSTSAWVENLWNFRARQIFFSSFRLSTRHWDIWSFHHLSWAPFNGNSVKCSKINENDCCWECQCSVFSTLSSVFDCKIHEKNYEGWRFEICTLTILQNGYKVCLPEALSSCFSQDLYLSIAYERFLLFYWCAHSS